MDGAQAVEMIRGLIRRERVSFLPDTLEYLRAGGRVSNAAYLGTSLLRLKVLINMVDGQLVASKKYRGDMDKVSFQYLDCLLYTSGIVTTTKVINRIVLAMAAGILLVAGLVPKFSGCLLYTSARTLRLSCATPTRSRRSFTVSPWRLRKCPATTRRST